MGMFMSKVMDALGGRTERRILMLGLDAAGKTTVLYKLKLNEAVQTIPTIGFNVDHLKYKNLDMTMWDVGGLGQDPAALASLRQHRRPHLRRRLQ